MDFIPASDQSLWKYLLPLLFREKIIVTEKGAIAGWQPEAVGVGSRRPTRTVTLAKRVSLISIANLEMS